MIPTPELPTDAVQTTDSTRHQTAITTGQESLLTRLLNEPLLHFAMAGVAIYVLFGWLGRATPEEAAGAAHTIVITRGEIDWLTDSWQKRWNRPPTAEEFRGLVRAQFKETALYREALSMGLDEDDVIVRRRLAQKLEFLAQDLVQPATLSRDDLETYFQEHIGRYQPPDLVTLTHVFFDPDQRGEQTLEDAKALRAELVAGKQDPRDSAGLGDPFMLQGYYPERSEADLAKLFGGVFARSVMQLQPGTWHGPVLSGYGTHLVYIHEHRVAPLPQLEDVMEQVCGDLEDEKRRQLNDEFLARLLDRYRLVVEGQPEYDRATVMEPSR